MENDEYEKFSNESFELFEYQPVVYKAKLTVDGISHDVVDLYETLCELEDGYAYLINSELDKFLKKIDVVTYGGNRNGIRAELGKNFSKFKTELRKKMDALPHGNRLS